MAKSKLRLGGEQLRLFTASLFSGRERKCGRREREARGGMGWGLQAMRGIERLYTSLEKAPPSVVALLLTASPFDQLTKADQ